MTDRPIIFSAPMVRALLDGRKTQTRRVLKPQPVPCLNWGDPPAGTYPSKKGWSRFSYAPGDRLYVREAFTINPAVRHPDPVRNVIFRADVPDRDPPIGDVLTLERLRWCEAQDLKWRPSIHMPRWASRLTLTVTAVRVQRLQDISEADAVAEGSTLRANCSGFMSREQGWSMDWSQVGQLSAYATGATRTATAPLTESDISLPDPQTAFASYFNSLHGPDTWADNPWVVALTFGVHRCNIDRMKG